MFYAISSTVILDALSDLNLVFQARDRVINNYSWEKNMIDEWTTRLQYFQDRGYFKN